MPSQISAFRIQTSSFGAYQLFKIEDPLSGNSFSIIPRFGACLTELILNKKDKAHSILDSYSTIEELDHLERYKSFFLFPFPNRLQDGQYEFEGKSYAFPINEKATNTRLHGFAKAVEMEIKDLRLAHDFASITIAYQYAGKADYYPFPFNFTTRLSIDNQGSFEVHLSILNTGKKNLPIGMGWHPYLKFNHPIDELKLKLPKVEQFLVNENLIPTSKKTPAEQFQRSTFIGKTDIDDCYEYRGGGKKVEIEFQGKEVTISYWQNANPFQYFQLYIPPNRASIAVEPMTCAPNAFQNKEGLRILAPNEELEGSCGFYL